MEDYIPALKYHFLTPIYDYFIWLTMPEKRFKNTLIRQMNIQAGEQVLDFGAGTITLTLLAEKQYPKAHFSALDIDSKMLKFFGQSSALQSIEYAIPYPALTLNVVSRGMLRLIKALVPPKAKSRSGFYIILREEL